MLSLIIESVVFSIILIILWFGFEALLPRLSSWLRSILRKYRKRHGNNHKKRRKRATPVLGPSMPHFWR